MKYRYTAAILIVVAVSWAFSAIAAPTSTTVQNLFITGLKNGSIPCLNINGTGFVATTSCSGGSGSFAGTGTIGIFPQFTATSTIGNTDIQLNSSGTISPTDNIGFLINGYPYDTLQSPSQSGQPITINGGNGNRNSAVYSGGNVYIKGGTSYGNGTPGYVWIFTGGNDPNNPQIPGGAELDTSLLTSNAIFQFPNFGGTFALVNATQTFSGTVINGQATTTKLSITSLSSSGNPCLVVGTGGAVSTSTCGSGGSGGLATSTNGSYASGNLFYAINSSTAEANDKLSFSTSTGILAAPSSTFTGQVLVPNGAAASPGFAFTNSTNTGFTNAVGGNARLTIVTGGVNTLYLDSGNNQIVMKSTNKFGWASGDAAASNIDTGISRDSTAGSGVFDFGTGAANNASGTLNAASSTFSNAVTLNNLTFSAAGTQGCQTGLQALGTGSGGKVFCYNLPNTGNWAGTWQGVNSSTFYLASNPAGYLNAALTSFNGSTSSTQNFGVVGTGNVTTTVATSGGNSTTTVSLTGVIGSANGGTATTTALGSCAFLNTCGSGGGVASTSPFTVGNLVVVSSSGALATISSSTYITTSTNNFGGLTNASITAVAPITWSASSVIGFNTSTALTLSGLYTFNGGVVHNSTTTNNSSTILAGSVSSTESSALILAASNGVWGSYGGASACAAGNAVTTITAVGGTTCAAFGSSNVSTSTANTWTALQTFNGGLTANSTTTNNSTTLLIGAVAIGTSTTNGALNIVGQTNAQSVSSTNLQASGNTTLATATIANSLTLPTTAGCGQTASGTFCYDTSNSAGTLVSGGENATGTIPRNLFIKSLAAWSNGGTLASDTITSAQASNTQQAYQTTYTIPANFLTLNKTLCVTIGMQFNTSSTDAFTLAFQMRKAGSATTTLAANSGGNTPIVNKISGVATTYCLTALSAPSSTAPIVTTEMNPGAGAITMNAIAQPVTIDTTSAQILQVGALYANNTVTATSSLIYMQVQEEN